MIKAFKIKKGMKTLQIVRAMIKMAKKHNCQVSVRLDPGGGLFEGIEVVVDKNDNSEEIARSYEHEVRENDRRFNERLKEQFYGKRW